MKFFIFKGAPAAEDIELDGRGDPGLPGVPGFQVSPVREGLVIIRPLALALSPCLSVCLSFSFFSSLCISVTLYLSLSFSVFP